MMMNKMARIGLGFLLLLLLGGFLALAFIDVPVKQSTITATIPHERFFKND